MQQGNWFSLRMDYLYDAGTGQWIEYVRGLIYNNDGTLMFNLIIGGLKTRECGSFFTGRNIFMMNREGRHCLHHSSGM